MEAVTEQRLIQGDGTSEDVWQRWLQEYPPASLCDASWLLNAARVVVVAPHPDDEVLACGGVLAMRAAHAGEILIVAVTDGEASHGAASGPGADALARRRRAERVSGLQRLGLRRAWLHRCGLPDGRVERHEQQLAARLAGLLRASDIVIASWRLDGHPDHDATGRAAASACTDVGCRLIEAPIWMWHWASPDDERVPWQRLAALPIEPLSLRLKQAALRAHASQLTARSAALGPVLDAAICGRARRPHEYFFVPAWPSDFRLNSVPRA